MMDGLTVTAATKYPKVDGATEQKGEPMDLIDRRAREEKNGQQIEFTLDDFEED